MCTEEKYLQILELIKAHRNGDVSESMTRMGIQYGLNYGVSIPELRVMAITFACNHDLALKLFEEDIRECKILASMIDDPAQVTGEQIDGWSQSFINHEIVEQVCGNLFWKSEYALSRSIEWCLSDEEMMQKAGLIIASHWAGNKEVKDSLFEPYIDILDEMPEEQIERIKNSTVFALRQIGQRNELFRGKVIDVAHRMTQSDGESRAWVGSQLLYDLQEE